MSLPSPDESRGRTDTLSRDSRDSIKADLTTERPRYVLSSYGPGKGEASVIKGLDVSPEELRVQFYTARSQNNPSLYVRPLLLCLEPS